MANAQGLGQGVAAQSGGMGATPVGQQFAQPSQMSGGLGNQFTQTPPQNGTLQMPASMQRTQGGFGLSPQMLQLIAHLQQRSPQFSGAPAAPPPGRLFQGLGQSPMVQNPYQIIKGRG